MNRNLVFYILMALAMTSWGSSWVSAKILSEYITGGELIIYRYIISTIAMIPILVYYKYSFKIDRVNLVKAMLGTIFLFAYSMFFFYGTKYGQAGLGGAFVTTLAPIVVFILLVAFFGKKIYKKDIIALAIGAVGVLTILNVWQFSYDKIFNLHNGLFVLAAISWPLLTITTSYATNIKPIMFSFYMYLFLTILAIIFVPIESGNIFRFDWIFWLNLINISVISTSFATSIYFIAITRIGTGQAAAFIFLVPFNVIILSFIFLDEQIYLTTIVGTVLTIIAVANLNNLKWHKVFKLK
jgi:drug/metabolite transporter (DMT)-like permease